MARVVRAHLHETGRWRGRPGLPPLRRHRVQGPAQHRGPRRNRHDDGRDRRARRPGGGGSDQAEAGDVRDVRRQVRPLLRHKPRTSSYRGSTLRWRAACSATPRTATPAPSKGWSAAICRLRERRRRSLVRAARRQRHPAYRPRRHADPAPHHLHRHLRRDQPAVLRDDHRAARRPHRHSVGQGRAAGLPAARRVLPSPTAGPATSTVASRPARARSPRASPTTGPSPSITR